MRWGVPGQGSVSASSAAASAAAAAAAPTDTSRGGIGCIGAGPGVADAAADTGSVFNMRHDLNLQNWFVRVTTPLPKAWK